MIHENELAAKAWCFDNNITAQAMQTIWEQALKEGDPRAETLDSVGLDWSAFSAEQLGPFVEQHASAALHIKLRDVIVLPDGTPATISSITFNSRGIDRITVRRADSHLDQVTTLPVALSVVSFDTAMFALASYATNTLYSPRIRDTLFQALSPITKPKDTFEAIERVVKELVNLGEYKIMPGATTAGALFERALGKLSKRLDDPYFYDVLCARLYWQMYHEPYDSNKTTHSLLHKEAEMHRIVDALRNTAYNQEEEDTTC